MAQTSHPTLINLPPPGSNPETPSEMPGTPTSTTTSLSALSTTAIKDGHRGHFPQFPGVERGGHQHNPSTTSLEAERADRISRLAGLERVSTLRAPPNAAPGTSSTGAASSLSPQTTPTSTGLQPNYYYYPGSSHPLTPAYFDGNGQPVAVTKMSTVGSASATESHVGEGDDSRTTAADCDEDMLSTDTNYREAESVASTGPDHDPMMMNDDMDRPPRAADDDDDDDRMSDDDDDGSASLVGFGEGAGSTVSGPIYHRRPLPNSQHQSWNLERTNSGLSDVRRDNRDTPMAAAGAGAGAGTDTDTDTPVSISAIQERRDARMMDGIAADQHPADFVDTTTRGPVPVAARETAENIVQQRLDQGESRSGPSALGAPGPEGQSLGNFYFEGSSEHRRD